MKLRCGDSVNRRFITDLGIYFDASEGLDLHYIIFLRDFMDHRDNETPSLILESSLQSFFFDKLQTLNKKTSHPVSNESIYYLSLVLDQFGDSKKLFEEEEGKVREKVLGIKLLEASHLPEFQRKRSLREIGDTALFVCGYFHESLNSKLIDVGYYENLGQIAYKNLDNFIPKAYEVPSFFVNLSQRFSCMTNLISIISKDVFSNDLNETAYLIVSDKNKIKVS